MIGTSADNLCQKNEMAKRKVAFFVIAHTVDRNLASMIDTPNAGKAKRIVPSA